MNIGEIIAGGGIVMATLSILEVSPIKINPWSSIFKCIRKLLKSFGKMLNSDMYDEIAKLHTEIHECNSRIDNVDKKVSTIEKKKDESDAVNMRNRILSFGDDLMHGVPHSKGSFDHILIDITNYNNYCREHKSFKNNITESHSKLIEKRYMEHLENNDFL